MRGHHSTPDKLERTRVTIPMARLDLSEDCAGTCLYLASDNLSGYVTGQVIEVNGGQLMPQRARGGPIAVP